MNDVAILMIVSFIIILITIIIIIGNYGGSWTPATLNTAAIDTASTSYQIPSAWSGAQPVRNSPCLVYTFVSVDGITAQPTIDQLNLGNTGIQPIAATCTDDDQIFAQQMYHVCRYGEFQDLPAAQFSGCLLVDGSRTKIDGYYEEFYNTCGGPKNTNPQGATGAANTITSSTSTRCDGSVSLIMFNFQSSVNSAICVRDPIYAVDGMNIVVAPDAHPTIAKTNNGPPSPIYPNPAAGCNIGETQQGFPSQLWRITRHTYDGVSFTVDDSGSFINILHRPSGKFLAPYTLNTLQTSVSVSNFIASFSPILIPTNSFDGRGCFWYLTPSLLMPAALIRGVRPDPDPMLPSTIVGGPEWDGLYWADQQRVANPQLIWAPNPNTIHNLTDDVSIWNFLTSTTNPVYSLIPFVRVGNTPVFSRMSLTSFLTYPLFSGNNADNILPITNPESIYYPTIAGLQAYATANSGISTSGCSQYNAASNAFLEPAPGNPGQFILVPITFSDACYQEYTDYLYAQYIEALVGVEERILSETASIQFIDFALYATILGNVGSYFGT